MNFDAIRKLFRNLIFFGDSMEDFQLMVLFVIQLSHILYDFADFRDIVSENDTRNGFDENEAKGFYIIVC